MEINIKLEEEGYQNSITNKPLFIYYLIYQKGNVNRHEAIFYSEINEIIEFIFQSNNGKIIYNHLKRLTQAEPRVLEYYPWIKDYFNVKDSECNENDDTQMRKILNIRNNTVINQF